MQWGKIALEEIALNENMIYNPFKNSIMTAMLLRGSSTLGTGLKMEKILQ